MNRRDQRIVAMLADEQFTRAEIARLLDITADDIEDAKSCVRHRSWATLKEDRLQNTVAAEVIKAGAKALFGKG